MIAIPHLKGIVLETYGAGNSPNEKWILDIIKEAVDKGIIVVNVTQCTSGAVDMMRYESGKALMNIGVIPGYDITTEAAVAKLMFLFGRELDYREVKTFMAMSLVGESTVE